MSNEPITRVMIIGAGWVGRQVAARMAQFGVNAQLCDRDSGVTEDALSWIRQLEVSSENWESSDWQQRVEPAPPLNELRSGDVSKIQLALECVPEQVSLKKRVLRQLGSTMPPECIIASNSSYFVPSMLSKFVANPKLFAHMHFHVPVLRESVCDIVGCAETAPEVIEKLTSLADRIRQPPIVLRHEHPGYIFNWLLQSVLKGALELAAQDVVDPEQIDRSWKAVTGMPLGPFGMMDQIGLDVIEQVLSNSRWASPTEASVDQLLAVLRPLVDAGKLGVKTRAGFYDYET